MGPGGQVTARLLCGLIFEAQANVVVQSKRSKSETMIDRDNRRRMQGGGRLFVHGWLQAFKGV